MKENVQQSDRLLTNGENGPMIRTLRGRMLVGLLTRGPEDQYSVGLGSPVKGGTASGLDNWFIIEAASGKLGDYTMPDTDQPGQVRVFPDWGAMRGHVPPELYREAAVKAGIIVKPELPVEPLTEAE